MKVTKYLYSCLLLEDDNKTALIDPGIFTYNQKVLTPQMLNTLDYILITHNHFDHMSIDLIKELIAKFPNVKILSNDEVVSDLKKEGLVAENKSDNYIKLIPVNHERMFGTSKMSENTQFDVFGKLSHPGDSLSSKSVKEIFALPIDAPWGSTTWAVETAIKLKPKVVIPIHDYLWKDEVTKMFAQGIANYFKTQGIDYKIMETGVQVEI